MRSQRVSPFYRPSIHQMSTFEKTKFYQYSILSWLDECAFSTGLSVLSYFSVCGLRGGLFFFGLSDATEHSTTGVLSLHRETKFIIGFDFAVTLSLPESFCVLFRHHLRTLCRTVMAKVKQTKKDDSIHHV